MAMLGAEKRATGGEILETAGLKVARKKQNRSLWRLLPLVALLALVSALGPGLVRSTHLPLPVLNNLQNPVRLEGFYPTEANTTGTYRWSEPQAKIFLPEPLTPQKITLDVSAAYPENTLHPRLHLYYNSQEIGNWAVAGNWTRLEATFPATPALVAAPLELVVENPLPPRNGDNRALGVAIRAVDLEVSRVSAPGVILSNLALGIILLLVASWLGFGMWQSLIISAGPVLLLSLYWQLDRFYVAGLVGFMVLLAGLSTLVALRPYAFFPAVKPSSGYWYLLNGGFWRPLTLPALFARVLELLPPLLICGAVFFEYGRALDYGFFWDDYHIARPWTTGEVAGTFAGSWDSLGLEPAYFRPLTVVSFALDWLFYGYEPRGYHLTNLLLFAVTALLLYALLRRLKLNWLVALGGALLFVLLPSNVATADWISQRSDSLSACFMLAGLLAFSFFWQSFKIRWLVLANLGLLLALGCKEIAVILPGLFWLYAWLSGIKRAWKGWLKALGPSCGLLALYLGWRGLVLPAGNAVKPPTPDVLWSGYTGAVYQGFYGLDNWLSEKAAPWLTLLLLALTGLLLLKRGQYWRKLSFGLGWLLVACAPLALLATSYSVTARVLFLPEIGYAIGAAALLDLILRLTAYSRGGWRFWPSLALFAFLLLAPYNPLHLANQRAQKDYAPNSFNTLRWDRWIYENPAWKDKIPERHFKTIEDKLKANS
jgi:hypothetical protein